MSNSHPPIVDALWEKHGIHLDAQQLQAVCTPERIVLLLAVPGSGKTTVLVSRLAHDMWRHVPADSMLTLTYNRESAKDMERRFQTLFGGLFASHPTFSTIHSFCYGVLHRYARVQKREMPRLLEEGERTALLRTLYRQVNHSLPQQDEVEAVANAISFGKNMLLSNDEVVRQFAHIPHLSELIERYETYKRDRDRMDFDDMLTMTLGLLRQIPSLLACYRKQYTHIMVDEAQDISRVQLEILSLLCGEQTAIFAVGDEDQSIYGFRGAYPEGLLHFGDYFPGAAILTLEQNYRSGREIVRRANLFIRHNPWRYQKNMLTTEQSIGEVHLVHLSDSAEQGKDVVHRIRLAGEDSCAVLYRNNDTAVMLADELSRANIPFYVKEHHCNFFTSQVVRDIRAFIRIAYDPTDLSAFRQIYYRLRLSRSMYDYVERNAVETSVFETLLRMDGLDHRSSARLRGYIRDFPNLKLRSPYHAIRMIEENFGYLDPIMRLPAGTAQACTLQKLAILRSIASSCRTLFDFLDRLDELETILSAAGKADGARVTLATAHSSKGQEWDHVWITDLFEGIFPTLPQDGKDISISDRQLAEEIRLFYVSATRARKGLTLYRADAMGGVKVAHSRFLDWYCAQSE